MSEQNRQPIVWVVTDGNAARRPVTLGADRIDQVEVKSGVVAGETVIINAPAGLADRARVRIRQ